MLSWQSIAQRLRMTNENSELRREVVRLQQAEFRSAQFDQRHQAPQNEGCKLVPLTEQLEALSMVDLVSVLNSIGIGFE